MDDGSDDQGLSSALGTIEKERADVGPVTGSAQLRAQREDDVLSHKLSDQSHGWVNW